MPLLPKYTVFKDDLKPKLKCRVVTQKHLNYMFRYEVSPIVIVTSNQSIYFNPVQFSPEKKCYGGACRKALCNVKAADFMTCSYEWSNR